MKCQLKILSPEATWGISILMGVRYEVIDKKDLNDLTEYFNLSDNYYLLLKLDFLILPEEKEEFKKALIDTLIYLKDKIEAPKIGVFIIEKLMFADTDYQKEALYHIFRNWLHTYFNLIKYQFEYKYDLNSKTYLLSTLI